MLRVGQVKGGADEFLGPCDPAAFAAIAAAGEFAAGRAGIAQGVVVIAPGNAIGIGQMIRRGFGGKLGRVMGPEAKALAYLERVIQADHVIIALEGEAMDPMRRVIAANMRHAAALRIDHVLGFARQFWVPRGGEGRDGAYVRFPLDALIAVTAIESHRHRCLVVGEDLGTVPDGLRETLAAAQVLSYRVLWFERDGIGFKSEQAYPPRALACLASHDLPTFMGWRAGRDIDISRTIGELTGAQAAARAAQRAHRPVSGARRARRAARRSTWSRSSSTSSWKAASSALPTRSRRSSVR